MEIEQKGDWNQAFTGKFQKRHFAVIKSWRADCECDAQHSIWQKIIRKKNRTLETLLVSKVLFLTIC